MGMYLCDQILDQARSPEQVPGGQYIELPNGTHQNLVACQLPAVAMRGGQVFCAHHWLVEGDGLPEGWPTGRVSCADTPLRMFLTA